MVFFTCNGCGESIKKNAVEKHYQTQCKKRSCLSCVDCGKTFTGNSYKEHIKCISEAEKYSGKGFKPKPNANKGEVKQTLWLEQVHNAIGKCKNSDSKLKRLLERLVDYPNIPRKKAKFENFIKNSMGVHESSVATRAWDVIAAEMNAPKPGHSRHDSVDKPESVEDVDMSEKKLSKKEKKEARRKQQHKEEKKSKKPKPKRGEAMEVEESTSAITKKKKDRKRKHDESDGDEEVLNMSKKKKKNKDDEGCSTDVEMTPAVRFTWEGAIIEVLKHAVDNELTIKKLRKKVLAQYYSCGVENKIKSEEELLAKFNKKIKKNPRLRTLKDRVKLLH